MSQNEDLTGRPVGGLLATVGLLRRRRGAGGAGIRRKRLPPRPVVCRH